MRFVGSPAADAAVTAADAGAADAGAADAGAADAGAGAAGAGPLLAAVKQQLFDAGAFARLLKAMLGVEILKHAGEVRRFRAGERVARGPGVVSCGGGCCAGRCVCTMGMRARQAAEVAVCARARAC
jgi:hypothetical protein